MVRKTTFFKWQAWIWLLLFQAIAFAQTPTITSFLPVKVTQRSSVVITGTNLTGVTAVKFNTVSAMSFTINTNGTAITAILPEITGLTAATNVTVDLTKGTNPVTTTTFAPTANVKLNYAPPVATPTKAKITRIITDWNGYWSSTSTSNTATNQPDQEHSVVAFEYDGTLYSTGNEADITNPLVKGNVTGYTTGNFRALPINNITGSTPATTNTGNPNLIVLGSRVDGSANTAIVTAPSVAGLTVRNVLIDGIRGLNIGSGVTNLPSSSVLTFQASNIVGRGIDDAIPDIVVSQVGAPDKSSDIYSFIDANGDIVGNPVQVSFENITAIGTYKVDLFTLPANTALSTAVVNGSTVIGANTRDMRLVAYKLSDFGIDTTNKDRAVQFKVMPSGTSDPAFLAYNRNTFEVPAPEINAQPISQAVCPGNQVQFKVTLQGVANTETTYQWERNGIALVDGNNISGAKTSILTINPVALSDAAIYRCIVTNASGATISNSAYLNTVILSASGASTCVGTTTSIEIGTQGINQKYQWYTNGTTNSNTGGSIIGGATSSTYSPPVGTVGTIYYYATAYNDGKDCTLVTSPAVAVTVSDPKTGTVSGIQTICMDHTAVVKTVGAVGNIQWQQSTDGTTWADVTTGTGRTSATYTTGALSVTTQYRAVVTSGSCAVTSGSVTVTVDANNTWTGKTSTDWNTTSNWSCGSLPTASTVVTIPSPGVNVLNQPTVLGAVAHAKSLIVQANAAVTIATAGTLQVVNEVNVDAAGTLTVQNNGSLIQDNAVTNNGNITAYKNSNPLLRLDYTMWSSPVSGTQTLSNFSPLTAGRRFYEYKYAYDNVAKVDREAYFEVDPGATFATAKGYLIRMPNVNPTPGYMDGTAQLTYTGEFRGVPNNGTITTPLSKQGNNYTAIGNPYPSPISVVDFFETNKNVIKNGSALYYWRKTNDKAVTSYATLTLAGYVANPATGGGRDQATYYGGANNPNWLISQGQGFIVQAATGATNPRVTFTNSMRRPAPSSGNLGFFREAQSSTSRLWLNLVGQEGYSQAAIAYIDGATTGIDYGYDGKLLNDGAAATLYSVADNTELSIQARPSFDAKDVVAMGYTAKAAGSYTLSIDHVDGLFEKGQDIFIKDNVLGVTHDITKGAYTFTTQAGTFTDRISVVYTTNDALGTNNPPLTANNVIIFKQGNDISITTGTADMSEVTVYDIRGRKLLTKNNINATQTTISGLTVQQQVLIVEVVTSKGKVSKKIVF